MRHDWHCLLVAVLLGFNACSTIAESPEAEIVDSAPADQALPVRTGIERLCAPFWCAAGGHHDEAAEFWNREHWEGAVGRRAPKAMHKDQIGTGWQE